MCSNTIRSCNRLTLSQANKQVEEKEEERKSTQNELDDLLIVFSDMEEKVTKYKVRFTQSCENALLTRSLGPT